jgi:ABC-2 type transport system ATP-binding protein
LDFAEVPYYILHAMSQPVVRIEGVTKNYDAIVALDGISFAIEQGKICGLLGANGAGKTTTIKILSTLVRPDRGRAEICGVDVVAEPRRARSLIGYVPQELTVDPYLTAREHLNYYAGLYHLAPPVREARIKELVALLGLAGAEDRRARHFSGGMKKKLDLACGLLHRPQVVLLDEPSLGLDLSVRHNVWGYIAGLKAEGTTVLLCTNYMDEAERLCDEVAIIDKGKIVVSGTPDDLRSQLHRDLIVLEVAHADSNGEAGLQRLEQALRDWAMVREIERNTTRLRIYVDANTTALARVLQTAGSLDIPIQSVTHRRPGLDEVFLHHTGHGLREEA